MIADPPHRDPARRDTHGIAQTLESFRLLVSSVRDYAIYLLDPRGFISSWNEGAERIKGYRADQVIGKHFELFYTPEDRDTGHPAALLAIAERDGRVEEEGWRLRRDGTRFWADVVITALRNAEGVLVGFGKVTRDLTERRQTEVVLTELSGRLLTLQDEERRRIARELHDNTSPLMARLLGRLHSARQVARVTDPGLLDQITDALGNAESVAAVIRTVSAFLHPPLLDESGLGPSLRWYLEAYSKRLDVRIEMNLADGVPRLPRETEIALFRLVQECVTTVLRAAQATRAVVNLSRSGGVLALEVRLNQELPSALRQHPRGELAVSLVGMRERLRQLGGTFQEQTGEGATIISATMPLKVDARHPIPTMRGRNPR